MKTKIFEEIFEGRNVIIETDENGELLFEIESTSMAIGYITTSKGKEYVHKLRMNKTLENAEIKPVVRGVQQFITFNQLNDFLIEAHTQKSKIFKRWVTHEVLPTIERTGAYIEDGREEEMINHYFSSISDEVKLLMIKDLQETVEKERSKNKELQQFYDDLLNTDGLFHMNMVAKQLKIGRNTMLSYLRGKGILFYQDNANVPYQRFMNQKYFAVVETPCADGKYRPVTYATKKGLEYIRKLLRKDGYYDKLITE